jgi:rubrerythrin
MIKYKNIKESRNEIIEELKNRGEIEEIIEKKIIFQNQEEAKEYLEEIVKEGKGYIVKYYEVIEDAEESKGLIELKERLKEEESVLNNFPYTIINKLKEQTSNKKSCKCCESSISRDYLVKNLQKIENIEIKDLVCPICGDKEYMFNSSEEKRLSNIEKRIINLTEKIREKENLKFLKAKKEEQEILGYIEKINNPTDNSCYPE